jgi:hypothetical protein
MNVDAAFQAKYISMARLLWDASLGVPEDIPESYTEHLNHEYVGGDISMGPLLSKFESFSELEPEEIEEAIEILGRVNPSDWPYIGDIESVSVEELLRVYDEDATDLEGFNFVEDNLGTAEKVEKVLIEVISSVFGAKVSTIRSEKGYFANPKNNFLQEDDGTFAGTFEYDGKKFMFEVAPSEDGWLATYRMHWDDIGKLPPRTDKKEEDKDHTRRVRHRSWK